MFRRGFFILSPVHTIPDWYFMNGPTLRTSKPTKSGTKKKHRSKAHKQRTAIKKAVRNKKRSGRK